MNLKVEYFIIAILSIAIIYYLLTYHNLVSDLSNVPHDNNPQLKKIKYKHTSKKCWPGRPAAQCCRWKKIPSWCDKCGTCED